MKNLFTMLFVAGIATGAFAAGTKADETVQITKPEAAKVAVAFTEAPKGTVIVKISDSQDRLIMRDRINQTEAFAKKYDLTDLPKGTYSIQVLDQSGVISSASVENFIEVKPEVFSRVSKIEGNSYRLLVSNLDSKEVEVMIYDGDKMIHSEMIDNPQGLHKIYKIEQAGKDGISFKVKTASGFESFVSTL
ncbi:MAG: hypothetical protein P8O16_12155 [Algoriphagus sp.]|uniref:hypothetical protein n=1 Tax=Algoriphagus sp. TaxID=1872435 RepID=UPI0026294047|nr:hypothetical protein [Algoriphagus sp.]MDG1278027.1 hypothetical protein [Algoriphagus sp.]